MFGPQYIISTSEISLVVNKMNAIAIKMEKCSKDFFDEVNKLASSGNFEGCTSDNLKLFADKFSKTTGNEISELTGEIRKVINFTDGYLHAIECSDDLNPISVYTNLLR